MTRSQRAGIQVQAGNAMRSILLVAMSIPFSASAALAATARTGDRVVVGPEEVIDDDLYALGWTIEIPPALLAVSLALGFVVSAEFAGASILGLLGRRDTPRAWALLLGLILLVSASRVPYVGLPLTLGAVVLGLGALASEVVRTQRAHSAA